MTKCKIIAEAGINHNGKIKLAFQLVEKAKKIGADYIKFQIYKSENLAIKSAKLAKYQSKNTKDANQYDLLKKYELSFKEHKRIAEYCKIKKINYIASAFDLESLSFYSKLNKNLIKIPSGEINNLIYLKQIKNLRFKNIIFSSGMASLNEIKKTYKYLNSANTNVIVMHCTSEYPAKMQNLNLNFLKTLSKLYNNKIGYSDHSLSVFTPSLAIALGAKYIEKHITLNNSMRGPDHKASFNIPNFKRMIDVIKETENILGKNEKLLSKEELSNKKVVRKSVVSKNFIKKGVKIKFSDLDFKRPGLGISPENYKKLIGKKLKKSLNKNEIIKTIYIK